MSLRKGPSPQPEEWQRLLDDARSVQLEVLKKQVECTLLDKKIELQRGLPEADRSSERARALEMQRNTARRALDEAKLQLERAQDELRKLAGDESGRFKLASVLGEVRKASVETKTKHALDYAQLAREKQNIARLRRKYGADHKEVISANKNSLRLQENLKASKEQGLADKLVSHKLKASLLPATTEEEVANLVGVYPIVLFPVRLETRFALLPDQSEYFGELLVRIYPDGVLYDTHEPLLDDLEVDAGKWYWQEAWKNTGQEQQDAWAALTMKFGATRTAWIVQQTEPAKEYHNGEKPEFHELDIRSANWQSAPEVQLLPDRWVIIGYRREEEAGTHKEVLQEKIRKQSRPVQDSFTLFSSSDVDMEDKVGPDSADRQPGDQQPVDLFLKKDSETAWAYDFNIAEDVGMAVRIGLSEENFQNGFDLILVFGVKSTLKPDQTQQQLEALFDHHRFTRGFSFVPQGTPTNNTESVSSGYPPPDEHGRQSFKIERATIPQDKNSDGRRFVTALGLHPQLSDHVGGADRNEYQHAKAMARVLWPTTIGFFMHNLMLPTSSGPSTTPVFQPEEIRVIRDFFVDYVRGRGPYPAFRIGSVPYGLLPVTDLESWPKSEHGDEIIVKPGVWSPVITDIIRLKDNLLNPDVTSWTPRIGRATYVKPEPWLRVPMPEVNDDLLDTLSINANATTFFVRSLGQVNNLNEALSKITQDTSLTARVRQPPEVPLTEPTEVPLTEPIEIPLTRYPERSSRASAEGTHRGVLLSARLGDDLIRIGSYFFFQGADLFTCALIPDNPASKMEETDSLVSWLLQSATVAEREQNNGEITSEFNNSWTLLEQIPYLFSIQQEFVSELDQGRVSTRLREQFEIHGIVLTSQARVVVQQTRSAWVIVDASQNYLVRSENQALHVYNLSKSELELLLTETLGVCSHRIDAWITGLATMRLDEIRDTNPEGSYMGAYGWVMDLRPDAYHFASTGTPTENTQAKSLSESGGYIYAPSITHANAAAVLRSAYLARRNESHDPYAINLSSARVRMALWLLDTVGEGQPLGAALGYLFERGLHEGHQGVELDQFIDDFRELHPIVTNGTNESNVPHESIAARNVVDGYALLEKKNKKQKWLPESISSLPEHDKKKKAIMKEVENLEEALDALADLMVAESVYQFVGGSTEGTSASLDTMAKGIRPPEPQIAHIPRGGTSLYHRVFLLLSEDPMSLPENWSRIESTPRAECEPYLNAWAGRLLGDPKKVKCHVNGKEISLADLELQPLDILALAKFHNEADLTTSTGHKASDSELDRRVLGAARPLMQPHEVSKDTTIKIDYNINVDASEYTFLQILEVAHAINAVLGRSRPLQPLDLAPPEEAEEIKKDSQLLVAEYKQRADTAVEKLTAAIQELDQELETARQVASVATGRVEPGPSLTVALRNASLFGVSAAFPAANQTLEQIIQQGNSILEELKRRQTLEQEATSQPTVSDISDTTEIAQIKSRIEAIFGSDYYTVSKFEPANLLELRRALGVGLDLGDRPNDTVSTWLAQSARVRTALNSWRRLSLYAGSLDRPLEPPRIELPRILQVPHEDGARWVGLDFQGSPPSAGRVSLAIFADHNPINQEAWCGILLDEWPELIPNATEGAGVVFHYDTPGAEAPHAVLLAVPPKPIEQFKHWDFGTLTQILQQTLMLAEIRAIDGEHPFLGPLEDLEGVRDMSPIPTLDHALYNRAEWPMIYVVTNEATDENFQNCLKEFIIPH